jgi:hypothetical protein
MRLLSVALMVSVLAASGCGKSAKPLTRAQLLAKADAICRRINKKLSSTTIKTQQDIARIAPQLATYEQEGLAELSKLIPPASMANDWKMIITGAQTLADNTAKLGEYVKSKDLKTARALITETSKVQQRTVAIAKRNGFKDCAQTA